MGRSFNLKDCYGIRAYLRDCWIMGSFRWSLSHVVASWVVELGENYLTSFTGGSQFSVGGRSWVWDSPAFLCARRFFVCGVAVVTICAISVGDRLSSYWRLRQCVRRPTAAHILFLRWLMRVRGIASSWSVWSNVGLAVILGFINWAWSVKVCGFGCGLGNWIGPLGVSCAFKNWSGLWLFFFNF